MRSITSDYMIVPADTGGQLGRVVLAYIIMTVVVITLAPFRFDASTINRLSMEWRPFDVVMNVVVFVPVGFIYQLSTRRSAGEGWRRALVIGALLSVAVESAQLVAPGRVPSVADVITNTAGAGLGAWLALIAVRRSGGAQAVRAFGVELPLMGIVYLLVPLAWLHLLGSEAPARAWCAVPLAIAAAWIIASVFTSYDRAPLSSVLLGSAAWMLVALAPGMAASPRVVIVCAVAGLGAAVLRRVAPAALTVEVRSGVARRFEPPTLRLVLPLLCLYVVSASFLPAPPRQGEWIGVLALFPRGQEPTNAAIFRALGHIGAFSVIGYAFAEYYGRARSELRTAIPVVVVLTAFGSAMLEYARGWNPAYGASGVLFGLTLAGSAFGSWLYILQLAHVRALTGGGRSAGAARSV